MLVLVGCGSEPRPLTPAAGATPSAAAVATPTTAPALATPVPAIGDIVWTTSVDPETNAPLDAVGSYRPDVLRMIAALPTRGIARDAVLRASWEYNDTPLETFMTEIERPGRPETTWVSFYLDRDPETLWPEGVYAIVVSLDGAEVQRATVEVTAAE